MEDICICGFQKEIPIFSWIRDIFTNFLTWPDGKLLVICISLSCSPADETDNGHKDDDQGMLKNLIPPFITVYFSLFSFHEL